jgi:hypothetical protein
MFSCFPAPRGSARRFVLIKHSLSSPSGWLQYKGNTYQTLRFQPNQIQAQEHYPNHILYGINCQYEEPFIEKIGRNHACSSPLPWQQQTSNSGTFQCSIFHHDHYRNWPWSRSWETLRVCDRFLREKCASILTK